MKRFLVTLIFVSIIAGTLSFVDIQALGQSQLSDNKSSGEVLTFSNQPIDHRYRMIFDQQDENTIMAIAQKSRMEKRQLLQMLTTVAKKYELEPALVAAIATQESMLDPDAVSHRGAMGLMQLMPATARRFGVKNILDPRQNAEGGARYIRYLLNEFNDEVELALAAYNAGSGAVLQYNNEIPPYGQTQTFVDRVLRLREHYRQVLQ